jgi:hypothetical protein
VFGKEDSVFGYATMRGALPVRILHGSALRTNKPRMKTPKKDNRAKVEIRFGDEKMEYERAVYPSYSQMVEENRNAFHLPDS